MASTFCVSETVVSAGSKLRDSIITHPIVQHDGDVEGHDDGPIRADLEVVVEASHKRTVGCSCGHVEGGDRAADKELLDTARPEEDHDTRQHHLARHFQSLPGATVTR